MAYTFDEKDIGLLPVGVIDTGYSTANGTANAIPTPPNVLGSVKRAFDPTYGEGEFIMLKGVASTKVGSVVVYDGTTYLTTLAATTKNQARPIAISMTANTLTSGFAWYQIGGTAVAAKGTASIQPKVTVAVTTTGLIGNTNSGIELQGARSANAATLTAAITTITLIIDRPHMQGRIT